MNKLHIAFVTVVLLAGSAAAQTQMQSSGDIDTAILVSTANYPDAMVSAAPAQKLGIPVLLTDKDELSAPAENALDKLNPEEVIIVGGPEVISNDVQTEVEAKASTTRLWGTTQIGTSVQVADYFWNDADQAVIVQYPMDEDNHRLLGTVKNQAEDHPVLVSDPGSLSADVVTKIEDLNPEKVQVYSTNAVNVTQDLKEVGVEKVELKEGESEQLEDQMKKETEVKDRSKLVIVAAGNFKDTISVPNSPNSASYIVSSEEQIDGAVTLAAEADSDTEIKVVGKPDLAQDIADRIESDTDKEVDRVSGEPTETAAKEAEENEEEWKNLQDKKMKDWKEEMNRGQQKAANKTLQKARDAVDENSSEELRTMLQKAETAYDEGNYFEARKLAIKVRSNARVDAYMKLDREEVREHVREERNSLGESMKEMKEHSQEMAEELRDAESGEERREIVREYREERKDLIKDLREERKEHRSDMMDKRQDIRERTRNRTSGIRERFRQREGDSDEVGNTEVSLEVGQGEVKARSEYTGPTGGYESERTVEVENGQINFHIGFNSPDSPATQAATEYRSEVKKKVEAGNYTANVEVTIDGETKKTLEREIIVKSGEDEENETEEEEENERSTETSLETRLEGSTLKAEAEYSGKTGGYGVDKNVNVDGNSIDITFDVTSPDGAATQVITHHNPKVEKTLEPGEYDVTARLVVDGETVSRSQQHFTVS